MWACISAWVVVVVVFGVTGWLLTVTLWRGAGCRLLRFALGIPLALALWLCAVMIFLPLVKQVVWAGACAWFVLIVVSLALNQGQRDLKKRFWLSLAYEWPWLVHFLCLFLCLLLVRSFFPAAHWKNDLVYFGSEKLFNLMHMQAYVFAQDFPPENLWLSGEYLNYYALLKALPGVLMGCLLSFSSHPTQTAGILFLVSDTFYSALGIWAVACAAANVALVVLPKYQLFQKRHMIFLMSLMASTMVLATLPLKSLVDFWQTGRVDFWGVQNVIPHVYVEYPLWSILLADAHSSNQVSFVSVSLLSVVFIVFQKKRPLSMIQMTIVCLLPGALLFSHPPSLLSVALVLALPLIFGAVTQRCVARYQWPVLLKQMVFFLLAMGLWGLLFKAQLNPPQTVWKGFWEMSQSPIGAFLNAQFWPLLGLCSLLFYVFFELKRLRLGGHRQWFRGLPMVWAFLAGVVFLCLVPEVWVTDLAADARTDWVRFNTLKKFWHEFFYFFPTFFMPLVLAIYLQQAKRRLGVFYVYAFVTFVIAGSPAVAMVWNRIHLSPQVQSLNALDFLTEDAPHDQKISEYLYTIKERVVVAETCGMGRRNGAPWHYGPAGRVAALSGRSTPCGWARHVWLWQPKILSRTPTHSWIWPLLNRYEFAFESALYSAYEEALPSSSPAHFDPLLLLEFTRWGITHVIVGDLEQRLHGYKIQVHKLAQLLNGRVVYETGGGRFGVISLHPNRM